MTIRFSIDRWAAWAPGLTNNEDWQKWLSAPAALSEEALPALPEMSSMMRRRLDRLGRVALQAAYWARGNASDAIDCPVIFASRFGDVVASVELLRQLAIADTMSPAGFSMSVHNAIGAMFSIACGNQQQYTAIAAGQETVEAAFVEASCLLADGVPAVLVVIYEEQLPNPFEAFDGVDSFPRAWACRLSLAQSSGFSLRSLVNDGTAAGTSSLPDLDVLRFLTSDATSHYRAIGPRAWHWERHA
ncbi:MAG: beta-ketoacyl synthase chain length factor [Pseudomonadota bacterium]